MDPSIQIVFSVSSVDVTCLVSAPQISSAHAAIVVGASPHHFLPMEDSSSPDQEKQSLKEYMDVNYGDPAEAEVKYAVIFFQEAPQNMSPHFPSQVCHSPSTGPTISDQIRCMHVR